MNYLNLTPHDIRIIREDVTVKGRHGKIYLRNEYSPDDSQINLLDPIHPSPRPMTLTETSVQYPPTGPMPIFSPACLAGLVNNLNFSEFDGYDVIIVSQKCATWINCNMYVAASVNQPRNLFADLILMDKFFIPYDLVYKDGKTIGALGLQKVTPYIVNSALLIYATAIQQGRNVSLSSLIFYCYIYTNQTLESRMYLAKQDGGAQEEALRVANNYLSMHGYNTYPTLNDISSATPVTFFG